MIEIIEYQNANKIELGIDKKGMEKLETDLKQMIREDLNDVDALLDDIFEVFATHGIVIE